MKQGHLPRFVGEQTSQRVGVLDCPDCFSLGGGG
jgi:hypothetical protein